MKRKILLASAFTLFLTSFYFLKYFDLSLNDIMGLPLNIIGSVSHGSVFGNMIPAISFILIQAIGFILIGIYSLKEVSKNRELIATTIGSFAALIGFLILKFSFVYSFFAIGFIISCFAMARYFPRFYEEYKVWRYYRAGSQTIKICFLIVAIFASIGVYLQIYSDHTSQERLYNATVNSLISGIPNITSSSFPGYNNLTPDQKAKVDARLIEQNSEARQQAVYAVKSQIDGSKFLSQYINNIAIITSVLILSALLFLRSLVAPIGGSISFLLLLVLQKKKHHHEKNST